MNELGFKELYNVSIKTTYPIELGEKIIEAGETIAVFDKVLLANFDESKKYAVARGGYGNDAKIYWENTTEVRFSLLQGVFSKTQLALMSGANLLEKVDNSDLLIDEREELESNENSQIQLAHLPVGKCFVYEQDTGNKIENFGLVKNIITLSKPYQSVIVDYQFNYNHKKAILTVGQNLTQGFLTLSGRVKVKDDTTGQIKTGIIKIPKLKLMSSLSMRLGEDATPQVGQINAIAVGTGDRYDRKFMEICFLDDDIDSDM